MSYFIDMAHESDTAETEQPRHLVGYARISTDDQQMNLQLDALVKHGVALEDIHQDTASGSTVLNRPGFESLKKDIRAGDIVVVWKIDRLGRDLHELLQTARWIRAKGAELRSLTEAIDSTTPYGILMFQLIGMFAEFERNLIRERTRAGQAAGRLRGRHPGRRSVPEEKIDAARDALLRGLEVPAAAKAAGISVPTLYRYVDVKTCQAQAIVEQNK